LVSDRRQTHPSLVALELENIDETALQNRIKVFFKDNAIQRIWELREFDRENYRIEAGVNDLFYGTGGEGYSGRGAGEVRGRYSL